MWNLYIFLWFSFLSAHLLPATSMEPVTLQFVKGVSRLNHTNYHDFYFSCHSVGLFLQWQYESELLSGFHAADIVGRSTVIQASSFVYTATLLSSMPDQDNNRAMDSVLVVSFIGDYPSNFTVSCTNGPFTGTVSAGSISEVDDSSRYYNNSFNDRLLLDYIGSGRIVNNRTTHLFICGAQHPSLQLQANGPPMAFLSSYPVGFNRSPSPSPYVVEVHGIFMARIPFTTTSLFMVVDEFDLCVACFFDNMQVRVPAQRHIAQTTNSPTTEADISTTVLAVEPETKDVKATALVPGTTTTTTTELIGVVSENKSSYIITIPSLVSAIAVCIVVASSLLLIICLRKRRSNTEYFTKENVFEIEKQIQNKYNIEEVCPTLKTYSIEIDPVQKDDNMDEVGPVQKEDNMDKVGPVQKEHSIEVRPVQKEDSIDEVGPVQKGDSIDEVGPLQKEHSIEVRSVQKEDNMDEVGPVQKEDNIDEVGPVQKEDSIDEVGPVQKEDNMDEVGPVQKEDNMDEVRPVQKEDNMDEVGPVQKEDNMDEVGPVQKDDNIDEVGPVQKEGSIEVCPVQKEDNTEEVGPLHDLKPRLLTETKSDSMDCNSVNSNCSDLASTTYSKSNSVNSDWTDSSSLSGFDSADVAQINVTDNRQNGEDSEQIDFPNQVDDAEAQLRGSLSLRTVIPKPVNFIKEILLKPAAHMSDSLIALEESRSMMYRLKSISSTPTTFNVLSSDAVHQVQDDIAQSVPLGIWKEMGYDKHDGKSFEQPVKLEENPGTSRSDFIKKWNYRGQLFKERLYSIKSSCQATVKNVKFQVSRSWTNEMPEDSMKGNTFPRKIAKMASHVVAKNFKKVSSNAKT